MVWFDILKQIFLDHAVVQMKMRRIFVHYIDLSLECILNKESKM